MKMLSGLLRHKQLIFFIGVFFLFLAWLLFSKDPDFGWHLRAGNYFMEYGIPKTDVFTYTASQFPWVDHEWLSDVFVAALYNIGSYWLLAIVYAAMWTGAIFLVSKRVPLSIVFLGVVAILPFAGVRQLTWAILLFALLMVILQARNKRWRLSLPLLFLLWANVHGSFLLGFAYGIWVLIRERSWKLLIIGVIAFALTFCNPYGYHVYTEIFRTMLDSDLSTTIVEWARFTLPVFSVPYALVWIGLLAIVNKRQWKQYVRFDVLLFVWSVFSARMFPIFVIASLFMMPGLLKKLTKDIPNEARERFKQMARRASIVIVCVASVGLIVINVNLFKSETGYPDHAVTYLKEHPCSGNLFNLYGHGGYFIWKLPDSKVYIDGRMPSWQYEGRDYMQVYNKVINNQGKNKNIWKKEFATYGISCANVGKDSPLSKSLQSSGWRIVSADNYTSLLIR